MRKVYDIRENEVILGRSSKMSKDAKKVKGTYRRKVKENREGYVFQLYDLV